MLFSSIGRNKWYEPANLKPSLRDKHMLKHGRSKSFKRAVFWDFSLPTPSSWRIHPFPAALGADSLVLCCSCKQATAESWPSNSPTPPQVSIPGYLLLPLQLHLRISHVIAVIAHSTHIEVGRILTEIRNWCSEILINCPDWHRKVLSQVICLHLVLFPLYTQILPQPSHIT